MDCSSPVNEEVAANDNDGGVSLSTKEISLKGDVSDNKVFRSSKLL
jgi:hypothetical protein